MIKTKLISKIYEGRENHNKSQQFHSIKQNRFEKNIPEISYEGDLKRLRIKGKIKI